MTTTETHQAIEAVWRIESAKLIAGITRVVKDVALAEDLAQDALIAALEQWPAQGVPSNPGAWLMTIAKRRAIDRIRRNTLAERKQDELGRDFEERQEATAAEFDAVLEDDLGDDLLRLMFISCHPVLSTEARVALTLRLLGGLTTDEIARAFLDAGADRGAAHRAGQAHAGRSEGAVRAAAAQRARSAVGVGARGHLPRVQRRLLGDGRRRLDAARRSARTRCVWVACWLSWRPRSLRCTASLR